MRKSFCLIRRVREILIGFMKGVSVLPVNLFLFNKNKPFNIHCRFRKIRNYSNLFLGKPLAFFLANFMRGYNRGTSWL